MNTLGLFDHYSIRARLQPALLTLLPAALGVFSWIDPRDRLLSTLWTILGTAGVTYFLAIFARNIGKQSEPQLWKSWGGAPTIQLLRHAGSSNPIILERRHKDLSKMINKSFPTAEEEAANPKGADQIYEAATRVLMTKTRNEKSFPLIYKETVLYGFCRNLYAMRTTGIIVSILGETASFLAGFHYSKNGGLLATPWICTALCAVFGWFWIFVVKSSWVRIPAFAYANRLFESLEGLSHLSARKNSAKSKS